MIPIGPLRLLPLPSYDSREQVTTLCLAFLGHLVLPGLGKTPAQTPPTNPFQWRFYLSETWTQGNSGAQERSGGSLTIATVDCQPLGCQSQVTFNFSSFQSIPPKYPPPYPVICFVYEQTNDACRSTWVETNGGCPYHYCNMHWTHLDNRGTLWQQPTSSVQLVRSDTYDKLTFRDKWTFFLTIPDPWDSRWASGVEASLYRGACDSYPMARLKIFRSYVRVVSSLVSLASNIKQQEKAISAIVDPGSKPQDSSNPFSWPTLVREGAQVVQMAGIHNISRRFLCAALNRPPLVAVPLPSPFNSSNLTLSFPLPSRTLGEVPLFQDPLRQQLPFCYSTSSASWCNRTGSAPPNLTAPPQVGIFRAIPPCQKLSRLPTLPYAFPSP
uniref:Uncharacterized protein n=1 Tax=Papio anubis TaxID=9555 RepID=A0A8I5MYN9_PAPAN